MDLSQALDDLAPGLRTFGPAVDQLRQSFATGDLGSLADPEHVSASMPLVIVAVVGFLLICLWLRRLRMALCGDPNAKQHTKDEDRPLRRRRQPLRRRLHLWWVHKWDQPWYWKIGKHVASLAHTHGLVVGGSGSGKSTLVVSLILQPCLNPMMWLLRKLNIWKRRKVVVLSFDRSDPIEEATNVLEDRGMPVTRWRVRQSNGWNLLQGDIETIAEALPEGWPHGENSGLFQQCASDAIAEALMEQDALSLPRDFNDMVQRVDRIMADDPLTPALARQNWVRRFRSLARVMGDSLGNDFDLVGALQQDEVVLHLSCNSYTSQALVPLVGGMALSHIKLAAEVVSDCYLVLEEASFLKGRSKLFDDLARALRARGWRIIYLSQDPNDVGTVLQVNFGVAVFMGLGPLAQQAREWCAKVVKGFPGAFRAEELVLGATIDQLEGYVLLNGKCRDVSLAPYITRPAMHRPAEGASKPAPIAPISQQGSGADADAGEGAEWDTEENGLSEAEELLELIKHQPHRIGPVAVPEWVSGRRLRYEQRDRARLSEVWANHVFPYGVDGCYETTYSVNQEGANGRPRCGYMGQSWLVYALVLAVQDGLDLDVVREEMKARKRSADHLCEQNRCVRVDHLRWVTSPGENSQIYQERRRTSLRLLQAASTMKQAPEPLVTAGGNTEGVSFDA